MTEEILYTDFRLPGYIPIISSVPEGAKTYAYRVVDQVGRSGVHHQRRNGRAGCLGSTAHRALPAPLCRDRAVLDYRGPAGRGLHGAAPGRVHARRRVCAGASTKSQKVAFVGIPEEDVPGITNLPITGDDAVNHQAQAANKTFEDLLGTANGTEEIRKLITTALGQVIEDTEEVFGNLISMGMCIYLPRKQYNLLTSTPFGDDANKSVWDFIKLYNPWTEETGETPMLKSLLELKGAAPGDDDRMIVAVNDTRVWEMAIPIYPRVITTLYLGFDVKAPMEFKISAPNIKRPGAIRYIDKI